MSTESSPPSWSISSNSFFFFFFSVPQTFPPEDEAPPLPHAAGSLLQEGGPGPGTTQPEHTFLPQNVGRQRENTTAGGSTRQLQWEEHPAAAGSVTSVKSLVLGKKKQKHSLTTDLICCDFLDGDFVRRLEERLIAFAFVCLFVIVFFQRDVYLQQCFK